MPLILPFSLVEVNGFLKNLYDKKTIKMMKKIKNCWDMVELAERYVFS